MIFSRLAGLMPQSEFGRNVLTMMVGTTLAQLIPIAVSPVLTRLYSPEQFGAFALFLGLASVLSIVATARYDLAVVLPESDEEGLNVAMLCIALTAGFGLLTSVVILVFERPLASLAGHPEAVTWLWLIPLMIILLGVNQVLANWANRRKRYRALAGNAIALHSTNAGISVLLGLLKTVSNGLILGRLAGQTVATLALASQLARNQVFAGRNVSVARMREAALRHYQFPLYNVPYSFVGSFSKEFLIFAFSAFGFLFAAGSWGLARSVLYAPIGFLSNSLGQVFYKEAADHFGTPRLETLANRLMQRIIDTGGPAFVFFAWWAPDLFAWVFGSPWREAGQFAAAFSPAAFLFLFTSWPERIYVVAGKQNVQFYIQVVSDVAIIATLWTMLAQGAQPISCVWVYTVLSIGYHIAYLVGVYRVAAFRFSAFWRLLRRMAVILGATAGVFALVSIVPVPAPVRFCLCAAVLIAYYAAHLYREQRTGG